MLSSNVHCILVTVSLMAACSGCGSRAYDGEQRFPLTGKVTWDGEPLDLGTISFLPADGKQRVSGGQIENGQYSVSETEGANAGKYRVEIRWAKKTGKQRFDSDLQMKVDERTEGLPKKFNAQSTLSAEVSATQTKFDFELRSK